MSSLRFYRAYLFCDSLSCLLSTVLYEATSCIITSVFSFCAVLMHRFGVLVFGSNPLCSSNVIFVFYMSFFSIWDSLSLFFFLFSLILCANIMTNHIPEQSGLIESSRRGEQQFMHDRPMRMNMKHNL